MIAHSFFPLLRCAAALALCAAIGAILPGGRAFAAASALKTVRMFDTDYVDARDFAARFGLTPGWLERDKKLRLQSPWTTIDLTVHREELWLNGLRLVLSAPVVAHQGSLFLGEGDIEFVLGPILSPQSVGPHPPVKTIVVDAGHGGDDPGKQNHALKLDEKKFTLDVARRLERALKRAGFRVVMTRKNDRAVGLDERAAIARRAQADLFVSIHFNAFTDTNVAGAETFVMTPHRQPSSPARENDASMIATAYPANEHDARNSLFGYHVHRHLVERLKPVDRGVKHFRYHVLRMVDCPGVLVEAAFISNAAEARQIASAAYRQQLAEAIASGIHAYRNLTTPGAAPARRAK